MSNNELTNINRNSTLEHLIKRAPFIWLVWEMCSFTSKQQKFKFGHSKQGGKDQESIQSSTTPDPGYHMSESLSHTYFWSKVYRQIVGIPIGF